MVSQVANTHFSHARSVSRVIHQVNDVGNCRVFLARTDPAHRGSSLYADPVTVEDYRARTTRTARRRRPPPAGR